MGGQWDNWVALAAGIVVGLSWVWHGLFGLGMVVLFLLGLATVLTAVLSLTRPGMLSSEAVLIGIGVLLVLTPWLFGFTGNLAAAWTAWVAGGRRRVRRRCAPSPEPDRTGGAPGLPRLEWRACRFRTTTSNVSST